MTKLGKKIFYAYRKLPLLIENLFDNFYLDPEVPILEVKSPDIILRTH